METDFGTNQATITSRLLAKITNYFLTLHDVTDCELWIYIEI